MQTRIRYKTVSLLSSVAFALCFLWLIPPQSATSQGAYFTGSVGYGLSAGTQYLGTNSTSTVVGGTSVTTYEGVYGSYGEGLKFAASAGYMFSKQLGAEVGVTYWLGKSFDVTSTSTTSSTTDKWSGKGLIVTPSVVVSAGMERVNPYARLGLVLGFMKVVDEYSSGSTSGTTTERTYEETGALAFGYAANVGLLIPAANALDFFAEFGLNSVTYSPSQRELTKYTSNNVNLLPTVIIKKTDYQDDYTSLDQNISRAARRPFSSIGIAVGARIKI
jgi:hypothetical protein